MCFGFFLLFLFAWLMILESLLLFRANVKVNQDVIL